MSQTNSLVVDGVDVVDGATSTGRREVLDV